MHVSDLSPGRFLSVDSPSRERRALAFVLCLAALVRIGFALAMPDQTGRLPDVLTYRTAAADILNGSVIASDFVMPGYPLLLALVGGGAREQLVLDIALSVTSVWLAARIAADVTGDRLAGLVAGTIWAFYPFAVFYAVVGLTETLFVTLVLLGFLAYYHRRFLWGSLALVAAILVRPQIEILAPMLLLTFVLAVHRLRWRDALRHAGVFAAVYVALMSPWWVHNYIKYGSYVRLNLGGGYVLYLGNNPMNRSGGGIFGVDADLQPFEAIPDPIARERALRSAALTFIRENPGRVAQLALLKLWRLYQPWPYAPDYARPIFTIVAVAAFLPIFLLSGPGVACCPRPLRRRLLPIGLFVGYTTAVHMATIASMRYRFPLDPFFVILAAPALAYALRRIAGVADVPADAPARANAGCADAARAK